MAAPSEYKAPLELAGYRLDRIRRELTKQDGTLVPLGSRAFDTLLALAARPGEVLTKQELLDAVWPSTVVEENNLTQAICALRKALGDPQDRPRIVLTVPGRGYSLIADVRTVNDAARFAHGGEARGAAPAEEPSANAGPRTSAAPFAAAPLHRIASSYYALTGLALLLGAGVATALLFQPTVPSSRAAGSAMTLGAFATDRLTATANSVAVLPFTTVGDPSADDDFVLGLHEEVITQLSRVSGLRVISRSAVRQYRDPTRPAGEIARELGVAAVLEGNVRAAGRQLRVSFQLSDATTRMSLWSASYDTSLDDLDGLFAAQSDVASSVANALAVELLPQERRMTSRVPTDSAQAYLRYLSAVSATSANDFAAALENLEETVALDPEFVEAWYRLANVSNIVTAVPLTTPQAHRERALFAAQKAVALDPDSANTHSVMGSIFYAQGQWERAQQQFGKAETLRRSSRSIADNQFRSDATMMNLALGDFAEARRQSEELLAMNPIHLVAISFLMLAHEFAGDHVSAMQQYARGKALLPTWWGNNPGVWVALGQRDLAHLDDAARNFHDYVLRNVLALHRDSAAALAELARLHGAMNELTPAEKLNAALFSAYFSRPEMAMDFLNVALQENGASFYMIWLPVLAEVRQTERFKAMLRNAGLVDHWQTHGWPASCTRAGDDFACR